MFEQEDFYGMEQESAIFLTSCMDESAWQYACEVDASELQEALA